jgi:hypothetical protein
MAVSGLKIGRWWPKTRSQAAFSAVPSHENAFRKGMILWNKVMMAPFRNIATKAFSPV